MKDKVLIGSISGIIGATISGLLAILLNFIGICSVRMLFLDSSVFLPKNIACTLPGNIYGFIIHLTVGAIIGIIYLYFLPFTGEDYLIYKGILLGSISWLVIGGLIGNILDLLILDTILDNTIFGILNMIFGLVTVIAAKYLRKTNMVR